MTRRGMSLIEVVIAMTLLAIVLTSLARVSVFVSSRGRTDEVIAQRSAAMQQQMAWLGGVPFTRLDSVSTGTASVTVGTFSYTRTIRITAPASNRRTITIVIVPTVDATKTDSITFDRAQPPVANPLCAGC
jgi:prepilin-type N-terminal cleavage/methylation domain-containing protein